MPEMPSTPHYVSANGIPIAVRDAGRGPAVILLHGFPELSHSWRAQVVALSDCGWHAIAPDLRGYGDTGSHGNLEAYSMRNLSKDITGLMDELGIQRAAIVGHDFGGMLAWTLARDAPDRVLGVISLNTPYTRRAPISLVETMRQQKGGENYMVQFQREGHAEEILERDVAATFRGMMRRPALTLAEFERTDPRLRALPITLFLGEPAVMGDPVMSDTDLQVYIDAYKREGFSGPLRWYRNLDQNWSDTAEIDDVVTVPSLMISAADDFFLPPATTRGMERHVPDLEFRTITNCGHWTQHERPDEVNAIILEWLERRIRPLIAL
jgi:soluble epoxide hydrolase / lipid-phosphate phosphatase